MLLLQPHFTINPMDPTDIFKKYYDTQFWGNHTGSSGPNSAFETTPRLRKHLQTLIDDLKPKSILDLGCGDANLFRFLNINGIAYTGIDCVPEMIEKNQHDFQDAWHMLFLCADILNYPLPKADLVICRDVVHYLPNTLIARLLENIKRSHSEYLLITHNLHCALSANDHTDIGVFRPVNLTYPPFHWPEPLKYLEEDMEAKSLGLWKKPFP